MIDDAQIHRAETRVKAAAWISVSHGCAFFLAYAALAWSLPFKRSQFPESVQSTTEIMSYLGWGGALYVGLASLLWSRQPIARYLLGATEAARIPIALFVTLREAGWFQTIVAPRTAAWSLMAIWAYGPLLIDTVYILYAVAGPGSRGVFDPARRHVDLLEPIGEGDTTKRADQSGQRMSQPPGKRRIEPRSSSERNSAWSRPHAPRSNKGTPSPSALSRSPLRSSSMRRISDRG